MKNSHVTAVGLMILGILAVTVSTQAGADDKPERVAEVKHIMEGIHKVHCGPAVELTKGDGPTDDKGWAELEMHAALMNESGHLLMENNRCPGAEWAKACATLQAGAAGVVEAAKAKDLAAAATAAQKMTVSCKMCHKVYKK